MITSWCTQVENSYLKRYASTTLSKSSFEHDDISGKKKKLNKFKRWRLTADFLALLTTSNYKLRSHNSPRTSHLPHTSPQMRIGKILIYAKGLCRVWWHRKTSEHSFRDGFEAVHEELVVQKCKKEKTTTTKEVFNAQNFSKRPPVEMIHQQVTKLNILWNQFYTA